MDTHRKRGYDDSNDYQSSKRHAGAANTSTAYSEMMFKILCPPLAVGSIIGKGGTVLNQLKDITNARIRVSLANEFYPGTNERVVGIFGPTENVSHAIQEITSRIIEVNLNLILCNSIHYFEVSTLHLIFFIMNQSNRSFFSAFQEY
jgi:hypothetical protein